MVRLRHAAIEHADLAKRLTELEDKTDRLDLSQDTFSRNTRAQLKHVFEALRELAKKPAPEPVEPPTPELVKRPIGFVIPEDKTEEDQ